MPRQNRVTPFGDIVATPERGTFTGNRGVLHDPSGRIVRAWRLRRWIVCALRYKKLKRVVMTPNRWTELFFLDEAAALAAGHRPCAFCRRPAFDAYRAAAGIPRADDIDDRLHAERLEGPAKRTFAAPLADLPDGVFVVVNETPCLLWEGELLAWSAGGYTGRVRRPRGTVNVLTPPTSVAALRAGYTPEVHPTATVE